MLPPGRFVPSPPSMVELQQSIIFLNFVFGCYSIFQVRFAPKAPTRRAPKVEVKTYISSRAWIAMQGAFFFIFRLKKLFFNLLMSTLFLVVFCVGFSEVVEDTDAVQARDLLQRLSVLVFPSFLFYFHLPSCLSAIDFLVMLFLI